MSFPRLKTIDSHFFMGLGFSGSYQYGYRFTSQWARWAFGADAPTILFDFLPLFQNYSSAITSVAIKNGWVFASTHFAVIYIAASSESSDVGKYWLCSSTNSGANWIMDIPLGDATGTHLTDVYILDRGICQHKDGDYVFGEYTGAQKGSALRVIKGRPGLWNTLATFNPTSSEEHIDHIHTVLADPFSNDIYIGTGDSMNSGNAAALIRWNGSSDWPAGSLSPEVLINQAGFGGFAGLQRYRVIDLIFTSSYIYSGADTTTAGELGIWRHKRGSSDPASWTNLYNNNPPGSNFWGGAIVGDRMIWITNRNANAEAMYIDIVVSDIGNFDSSTLPKFCPAGRIWIGASFSTTPSSANGWFVRDNKLYLSCGKVAGSTFVRQAIIEVQKNKVFDYNTDPHNILPKVWVSQDGTDSESTDPGGFDFYGCSPRHPFRSLQYAARAATNIARITHGHCVEVMSDLNMSDIIFGNWSGIKSTIYNGNAVSGPVGADVQIFGQGLTFINYSGSGDGPFRLDASDLSCRLFDIVIPGSSNGGGILYTNNNVDAKWILGSGCIIGNKVSGKYPIYLRGDSGATLIMESGSSIHMPVSGGDFYGVYGLNGAENIICKPGSRIFGGRKSIFFNGGNLDIDGLTALEYGNNGTIIDSDDAITIGSSVAIDEITQIKNVAASSSVSVGAVVGTDLTLDDSKYDYCFTTGQDNSVGGNSNGLYSQNGLIFDPDGEIGQDSVLRGAGDPNRASAIDAHGREFSSPPSVGAFEYIEVIIPAGSGARTSAGTSISAAPFLDMPDTALKFSSLSWVEIGEIVDVGEFGKEYTVVTHNPLNTRKTIKRKGSYNSGAVDLQIARVQVDSGQILIKEYLDSDDSIALRVQYQDGSIDYMTAQVVRFTTVIGGVDSITGGSIGLEIDSDIVEG